MFYSINSRVLLKCFDANLVLLILLIIFSSNSLVTPVFVCFRLPEHIAFFAKKSEKIRRIYGENAKSFSYLYLSTNHTGVKQAGWMLFMGINRGRVDTGTFFTPNLHSLHSYKKTRKVPLGPKMDKSWSQCSYCHILQVVSVT